MISVWLTNCITHTFREHQNNLISTTSNTSQSFFSSYIAMTVQGLHPQHVFTELSILHCDMTVNARNYHYTNLLTCCVSTTLDFPRNAVGHIIELYLVNIFKYQYFCCLLLVARLLLLQMKCSSALLLLNCSALSSVDAMFVTRSVSKPSLLHCGLEAKGLLLKWASVCDLSKNTEVS